MATMTPDTKRLLVVDDDPALRESLEELLRLQGYRVLTAAYGVRGFGRFTTRAPT